MLKIEHLTKYYGTTKAVEDLSLELNAGEIFGFIGPNGAGKSTTIKCIMQLINPNNGNIYIDNIKVDKNNENFSKLKETIGYLPSEVHLYEELTVKEMLDYSASFYKHDCQKKTNYLVDKLKLDLTKKIDELSFGNLKKVGIVLALMHDPKLIILDEATSGLDPLMQQVFYELLLEEKEKGNTIFFSSHNLNEIKKICHRVGIIKEGKLIKVEHVSDLNKSSLLNITLTANKDLKQIIKELKIIPIEEEKDTVRFLYKEDINAFLKKISEYKIEKLLIEEPSLEEIFIHYYE